MRELRKISDTDLQSCLSNKEKVLRYYAAEKLYERKTLSIDAVNELVKDPNYSVREIALKYAIDVGIETNPEQISENLTDKENENISAKGLLFSHSTNDQVPKPDYKRVTYYWFKTAGKDKREKYGTWYNRFCPEAIEAAFDNNQKAKDLVRAILKNGTKPFQKWSRKKELERGIWTEPEMDHFEKEVVKYYDSSIFNACVRSIERDPIKSDIELFNTHIQRILSNEVYLDGASIRSMLAVFSKFGSKKDIDTIFKLCVKASHY